jgi:ABC-type multidrug transport system fused ATPase/permease subunit
LVLENGQIAEAGDHETLLERDGLYAKMFKSQCAARSEIHELLAT